MDDLLMDGLSLVMVGGPSGVGKSRLAHGRAVP
ncbi:2-phosphoglycerate kinase [Nocardioides sp. BE266]|nr:2-phosphoglycerate kinase [Nocardioides sp. BE266]